MEEAKVALVPSVITFAPVKRYAMLLTDVRALFLFRSYGISPVTSVALVVGLILSFLAALLMTAHSAMDVIFAFLFGISVGCTIAVLAKPSRQIDYATSSVEDLANLEGSWSLPYASIEAAKVEKRRVGPARLRLTCLAPGGVQVKIHTRLHPDPMWLRSRKAKGVKRSEAYAEYAESVRETLKRSLPRDVAVTLGEPFS